MEAARARALAAPAALLPALPLHSSLGVQGTRGGSHRGRQRDRTSALLRPPSSRARCDACGG